MHFINFENPETKFRYVHWKHPLPYIDFHLHDYYEIVLLISGDVDYLVEQKIYNLKHGDLIVTNNQEIHKPSVQSKKKYERIIITFFPSYVQDFCSDKFDLLGCFTARPNGDRNKITLSPIELEGLLNLCSKMQKLHDTPEKSSEILKLTCLVEMLVLINKAFENNIGQNEYNHFHTKLIPILEYINLNLQGDLTLANLERLFYIDRFYLSRMFKTHTGSNLHDYIIYKRIALAKKLLAEGVNVSDTCSRCGFNDYSNFLKMFKRTVGLSPGKYKLCQR